METESNKNSMLYGMIEQNYRTKFSTFGLSRNNSAEKARSGANTGKNKKRSVLNTIKKMIKTQNTSESNGPATFSASDFLGRELLRHRERCPHHGKKEDDTGGESSIDWWWDPPQDSMPVEFCQDTSLHGLKYIGQSKRHLSERIFWFATFVVGLSVAIWLISEMWHKYQLNPVIVSFQPFETNVDQIPFPAVTICNMNKVMKSKALDIMRMAAEGDPRAQRDLYYMEHVCSSTKSFARRFNFSSNSDEADWQLQPNSSYNKLVFDEAASHGESLTRVYEFLQRAAHNCSEMIPLCVWQDQEVDCNTIFRPIETQFGKCCTFNMIPLSLLYTLRNDSREDPEEISQWEKWDIDTNGLLISADPDELKYPKRQMKAGLTSGLSFLLDVNSDEYYCTSSDSVGFRMTTSLPLELPKVADFGISLRPKSEIFVDVYPILTMVDPDIYSFSLEKRNCYKTEELKLRYFKHYSINNCLDECIANDTIKICGCKRYYMPRDKSEPLCGPKQFDCAEDVQYNKTKDGIRNTCPMCMQSCTEVSYEPQVTSTRIREGVWNFVNGSHPKWDDKDLSIVHVFIGEDSFYAKVRKELYGPTDLFANTGGLMGLCLGFSGLSFIELIYFLTFRAWWKNRRRQVIVEEEDVPKWTTDTSVLFSNGFDKGNKEIKKTNAGTQENGTQEAPYVRSIFGEIRPKEQK